MNNDGFRSLNSDVDLDWLDIFDHAPCGHMLTHVNGDIITINRTLMDLLGYKDRNNFDKKKFQELLSIGGKVFYETQHITLAKIQDSVSEVNYQLLGKSGERIHVLINSKIRRDISGKPLHFQHIIFPYSDRKKYESELILAKKKAETLSEAKSTFLSTITHEIRTPIHAIIGISDMLIQENPRHDQLEMLKLLQVSSHNLLELINSILEYNKVDAGKLILEENPFDLHRMLEHLVDSLRPQATLKGITIDLQISDTTPQFYIGDSVKINQILTNIVGNSLKFTLEGKVELQLDSSPDVLGKRHLEFKIIDTGIGMTEDEIISIFEPFEQANESINKDFGGTGIGLSISQKLLDAYSSKLIVESEKGKGSIFRFALRLVVADPPENLDQNSNTLNLGKLKNIRVLVVDDSYSNHFIISTYLTKWEVPFYHANNGTEALKLAQDYDFDVILMDLKMPDIDGFEVTKIIRSWPDKKYKDVPIIAYSAASSSLITDAMKDAGMNGLLVKPFRPEQLHRLLIKHGRKDSVDPNEVLSKTEQLLSAPKSSTFNPQMREVEELFDNDQESINKYLRAVIHDVETLKRKFLDLKSSDTFSQNIFMSACHSGKTITRLFELSQLSALFETGEKQLSEDDNYEFSHTLDEIILFVEKFYIWAKKQNRD